MATMKPADEEESPRPDTSKHIVIRIPKCTMVITENELIKCISYWPDIFERAIKRGKGYRRAASCEKRQTQVDRWTVYEWLKGNHIPENVASMIESINTAELREGVLEFILAKSREEGCCS